MTMNTEALMAKLFQWKSTVEIEGIPFYIRIVSDHVVDDARREALLAARKLRRTLRDVDSDDYLIYLDPLADLNTDDLQGLITTVAMREVMRNYLNTNPRPVITPLGDNPTQEEQEEWEEAKESRESAYIADMEVYVNAWREDYMKSLQARDYDTLLRMAKNTRIDQVCEEKFSEVFEELVVAASVYTDDKYKSRLFTVEQYKQLPASIKLRLRDAYNNLSISPDSVKN